MLTLTSRILRTMPWVPWLAAWALVAFLAWSISRSPANFSSRQLYVRTGLLVAGLGLTFTFDDVGAETTASAPSPLRLRRAVRALLGLAPWSILITWVFVAASQGLTPVFFSRPDLKTLPLGRLILEASTVAAWGLAIASVVAKRWDSEPGRIAAPGLLVLYAFSWAVPEPWSPWCLPIDTRWMTGHPLWWTALVPALLVSAVASWDSRIGLASQGLAASFDAKRRSRSHVQSSGGTRPKSSSL